MNNMYAGLIGTHQRSFEWYHPRPPMASLPQNWGFATQLPPLISGTGKATDFKFGGYIYRANSNKSPLKIFGENGAWAYPEIVLIFWVPPIISGTGKATDYKFGGYIYRVNLNKSLLNIFEKRERGRIQGLYKFWGYPLLSEERIKLRTSNFVGTFRGSIRTKARE